MSTPANPLMDQLPTGVDPQRAALLQSLFPQQPPQAGAAPAGPTAGAAPAQSPDIMGEMVQASQAGRQAFGSEREKSLGLGQQIEGLSKQQATASSGLAFHPNFKGGFLHNLGQALLTIGAATTPGRAVQNVIYSKPREEYSGRAAEIATLRGQQEESEKRGSAAAGMVSKPITAAGSAMRGEAAVSKADTYAQKVQNDLSVALRGLDLKGIATGSQAALNAAKQKFLEIKAKYEPERVAISKEGVELGAATRQSIADALTAAGVQKDHPIMSVIDSVFGTSYTPAAPQTSTGKTGTGATVPPTKPAKSAATNQVKDGATATGPNGHKIRYSGGKWVDAATGQPIQ